MNPERIHRDMHWTAEDRARHKAIRERFQRERPTPQELLASGEFVRPEDMPEAKLRFPSKRESA